LYLDENETDVDMFDRHVFGGDNNETRKLLDELRLATECSDTKEIIRLYVPPPSLVAGYLPLGTWIPLANKKTFRP
jgi:hypothetical protein